MGEIRGTDREREREKATSSLDKEGKVLRRDKERVRKVASLSTKKMRRGKWPQDLLKYTGEGMKGRTYLGSGWGGGSGWG